MAEKLSVYPTLNQKVHDTGDEVVPKRTDKISKYDASFLNMVAINTVRGIYWRLVFLDTLHEREQPYASTD